MAFGNDNIEIPVTLVTDLAERAAREFKEGFVQGMQDAARGVGKLDDSVKKVGDSTRNATQKAASGFTALQASIVTANQAISLVSRTMTTLGNAISGVGNLIKEGAGFDDLRGSLDDLAKKAGTTGEALTNQLSAALDQTVAKTDIMQRATEALFAGLKPDQINIAAEAARQFADVLGGSAKERLDKFTTALVRGNVALFDKIGIVVDTDKAERDYLKTLGVAANKIEDYRKVMEETQRTEAVRIASIDALKQKMTEFQKPVLDAGDRVEQLEARLRDMTKEAFAAVAQNESLNKALAGLVSFLKTADFSPFLEGLGKIVTLLVRIVETAGQTAQALGKLFSGGTSSSGVTDSIEEFGKLDDQIQSVFDTLLKGGGSNVQSAADQLQALIDTVNKPGAVRSPEALASIQQSIGQLIPLVNKAGKELGLFKEQQAGAFGSAAVKQIQGVTGAVTKQTTATNKGGDALDDLIKRYNQFGAGAKAAEDAKKEFEAFSRSVDDALQVDRFSGFTVAIERAFGQSKSARELAAAIEEIGKKALIAKVPLDEIVKRTQEQQRITAQGGFAPGNTAGALEAAKHSSTISTTDNILGGVLGLDSQLLNDLPASFDDLSGEIGQQFTTAITSALTNAVSTAFQAVADGVTAEDAAPLGGAIGTAVGAAIGAAIAGPAGAIVGASSGNLIGSLIGPLFTSEDGAGTAARKEADKFFADIFDENRLSIIIGDKMQKVSDLVFRGDTLFGGKVDFADGTFDDFLTTLPATAQAAFTGVGAAFEELLGVSDDISGQIGAVLANNIGGNLENLQLLIQSTGKSFEELADAIFASDLSIQQAQGSLAQLQDLFTAGIPGAIGDVEQAINNFNVALSDGRATRFLFDSLADIGAEALELGRNDFPALANHIAQSLGFAGQQVAQFFEAMKLAGITSISQLAQASREQLLAIAANTQQITQGLAPTNTPVVNPTVSAPAPRSFGGGGGGGGGVSKAQQEIKKHEAEVKRQREALRQETEKLVQGSLAYQKILDSLNAKTITNRDASIAIKDLYADIREKLENLSSAEKAYEKALEGRGKKQKDVAQAALKLKEAQAAVDGLKKSAEAANNIKLDFSGVVPLIKDLNQLGAVANAVGVSLQTNVDILIQGFLRGKLSIQQANEEINKTKDILSQGIPGAIGAVTTAFENLQKGGKNGGLFSVDAFRDVFAEMDELFKAKGSTDRQRQLKVLVDSFNEARDALQDGINNGATAGDVARFRENFENAKKSLEDFRSSPDKVGFEDLRSELEKTFSKDQVAIFFQALGNSGITTFNELKNAGTEAVVGILGDLDRMGFSFQETDQSVKDIINGLNAAADATTKGNDVLGTAVGLVQAFNAGIASLPSGFDDVIEKLTILTNTQWKGEVIFNVTAQGTDSQSQGLLNVMYGSGAADVDATIKVTGNTPGLSTGLSYEERKTFETLRRKNKMGKLTREEQKEFDELSIKRGK